MTIIKHQSNESPTATTIDNTITRSAKVSQSINEELYHLQLIDQLRYEVTKHCHNDKNFSNTLNVLNHFNSKLPNKNYQFDFIIENQRGLKLFGIPLFSKNSLIPIIDPSNFQLLNGKTLLLTYNQLQYYNLPDFNWSWCWDKWYILMYHDVDDQGWIYSNFFFSNSISDKSWKGKYYHGNFIRRRIWIKLRKKVDNGSDVDDDNEECNESIMVNENGKSKK
ncbi:hypothetical protein DFJ63DRAFT_206959 [Scheffersomyces coipomensis]|uniref:uncharacterized protein n=1 Tax=Scheffersomyces coipomensis TaxID=1788519 RepID=UPI00315D49CD